MDAFGRRTDGRGLVRRFHRGRQSGLYDRGSRSGAFVSHDGWRDHVDDVHGRRRDEGKHGKVAELERNGALGGRKVSTGEFFQWTHV